MAGSHVRRWRRALSLRATLVLVLVIGVWLGRWVDTARVQRRIVGEIRAYDDRAIIEYDDVRGASGLEQFMAGWWPPEWLEQWLGKDAFWNVTSVEVGARGEWPDLEERPRVFDGLSRLGNLQGLKVGFPWRDEDAEKLSRLGRVKWLEVAHSPDLSDRGVRALARMKSLEDLTLMGSAITDEGLEHLGGLKRLRVLNILDLGTIDSAEVKPGFTGEGLPAPERLPALRILNLRSTSLSAAGLEKVGRLKQLQHLILGGGHYEDEELKHLSGLEELESLMIIGGELDGTGVDRLAGLARLSSLELRGSNFGDAAQAHVASLPALERLDLHETAVTLAGLTDLRDATLLRQLAIYPAIAAEETELEGALPNCAIKNIKSLR